MNERKDGVRDSCACWYGHPTCVDESARGPQVGHLCHWVGVMALVAMAGCTDPFQREAGDFGKLTPVERLRLIEPSPLRQAAKPKVDPSAQTISIEQARARFAGLEQVPLTLEEVRASALEHNLDLRVALMDPTIAEANLSEEAAKFESSFTTRASWSETDTPTSSSLTSAQQRQISVEPGVRIPMRTGGTATVSLPMSRLESNNQFSTLNPAYNTDLAFSISHPLLRSAGRRASTHSIRIASYNRQISESQTKLRIISELSGVDRAYWNLYKARRDLDVRQQQYELAQAQLDRADRKVKAGDVREIEVVRAQAGVADRLEAIIVAQNAVRNAERELKRIANVPGLDVASPQAIVTGTDPDPVEYEVSPEPLLASAVENRMELLELELRLLADASSIDFARNQMLPQLDLDASYRVNGLGPEGADALTGLMRNNFEDWSVGANLSVPLGNEVAKSRLRQAILTRLQRLSTRSARELAIRQEVLDAIDAIDNGWQRILAARQSTILNTRTLQAEQRQFDAGASTSTNVLDAATRLAESQLAEIRAVVDYQISQVNLAQATGTLLGAAKIAWRPEDADQTADLR